MNACLNKALVVVLRSLLGDLDLGNFRVLFLLELFYHCVELFLALAILKQTTQFPETLQQSLSVRLLILISDFLLNIESVNVIAPRTNVCVLKFLYMFAIKAISSKNLHMWRFFCESFVNTSYFLVFLSFYHLSLIASRRLRAVVYVRLKLRACMILPSMSLSSCKV